MKFDWMHFGPRRLPKPTAWAATSAFAAGGLLLVWSAFIHVRLWKSNGYSDVPTIGTLFILQASAGMVMGIAVLAIRRVWVAVLGAGFAVSTMVGFLLSVEVGLFGFQDSWSAPFARQTLFIEIAATIVLIAAGSLCLTRPANTRWTGATRSDSPLQT